MEVRAVASIDEPRLNDLLQLLTALAGHEPTPIDIHEIVLRCESAGKQEVHLRHLSIPSPSPSQPSPSDDGAQAQDCWEICQYSRPPWGDLAMAKLPATVRTVTQAFCSSPDVPAFWKGLGFNSTYQHLKRGFTCDVRRGAWVVHVLVSRLHRVMEKKGGGGADRKGVAVVAGEEVVPSHVLVEVWTEMSSEKSSGGVGAHEEAMAAVVEVGKQLEVVGVVLQPLFDGRARPRGPLVHRP